MAGLTQQGARARAWPARWRGGPLEVFLLLGPFLGVSLAVAIVVDQVVGEGVDLTLDVEIVLRGASDPAATRGNLFVLRNGPWARVSNRAASPSGERVR